MIPAFAQPDYDTYDIYQGGNIVGVIYVPERGADMSVHTEYWVMSNRYVYPGGKAPVATQIVPSTFDRMSLPVPANFSRGSRIDE